MSNHSVSITRNIDIYYATNADEDYELSSVSSSMQNHTTIGMVSNDDLENYLSSYYGISGYKASKEELAMELCRLHDLATQSLDSALFPNINPYICAFKPEDIRFDHENVPRIMFRENMLPKDYIFPKEKYKDLLSETSRPYQHIFGNNNVEHLNRMFNIEKDELGKMMKEGLEKRLTELEAGVRWRAVEGQCNEYNRRYEGYNISFKEYNYDPESSLDLYLRRTALSLWVQANHIVNWNIASYSEQDLDIMFNARNYFGVTNIEGYSNIRFDRAFGGALIDNDVQANFLFAQRFIKETAKETLYELTRYVRSLEHSGGIRSSTVVELINNGTTPGCDGTTGLYNAILTSLNIPVKPVLVDLSGMRASGGYHSTVIFPTAEELALEHSDDPYAMKGSDPDDILVNSDRLKKISEENNNRTYENDRALYAGKNAAASILYRPSWRMRNYCAYLGSLNKDALFEGERYKIIGSGNMAALRSFERTIDILLNLNPCICEMDPFVQRDSCY